MAYSAEKEETIQLIGFYAGEKLLGADILTVREILRNPVIETLDAAPDFISGTVRLRGETIPVVPLKARLGGDIGHQESSIDWVLIARAGDRTVGYWVDSVTSILKIDEREILPAPELVLGGLRSQYIRGVCKSDLGLLIVLDLNHILAEDEIKTIKKL